MSLGEKVLLHIEKQVVIQCMLHQLALHLSKYTPVTSSKEVRDTVIISPDLSLSPVVSIADRTEWVTGR